MITKADLENNIQSLNMLLGRPNRQVVGHLQLGYGDEGYSLQEIINKNGTCVRWGPPMTAGDLMNHINGVTNGITLSTVKYGKATK